jgi:uncharacterized protein YjbI with pentapeptide repeats
MEKPESPVTLQRKSSSNQKLWLGVGIGALLTLIFMLTYEGYLPLTTSFLMGALFTVIVLLLLIVLGMHLVRDRFLKKWFGRERDVDTVVEDLKHGVQAVSIHLVDAALVGVDPQKKEDIRLLLPRFIKYFLFSQFRSWGMRLAITVLAALGSLLGTILLFHQNQLLQKQNEKIDRQIQLEEASRRSSLNFLLANVLEKMDNELKEADWRRKPRLLSPQVIGRIASLSQSYKPYRFMDGDTMIVEALSPERGNLLLAIVNSNLDLSTLDRLFEKTTFQSASLDGAVLDSSYLQKANLVRSNLKGANLHHARLNHANLVGVKLNEANLKNADLSDAMLVGSNLAGANLSSARLERTNLLKARLTEADLTAASMKGANLSGASLEKVSFSRANLAGAFFTGAVLTDADFTGADLSGAQLNSLEQLHASRSLYKIKGIPDTVLHDLKRQKPTLFENPNKEEIEDSKQ